MNDMAIGTWGGQGKLDDWPRIRLGNSWSVSGAVNRKVQYQVAA